MGENPIRSPVQDLNPPRVTEPRPEPPARSSGTAACHQDLVKAFTLSGGRHLSTAEGGPALCSGKNCWVQPKITDSQATFSGTLGTRAQKLESRNSSLLFVFRVQSTTAYSHMAEATIPPTERPTLSPGRPKPRPAPLRRRAPVDFRERQAASLPKKQWKNNRTSLEVLTFWSFDVLRGS